MRTVTRLTDPVIAVSATASCQQSHNWHHPAQMAKRCAQEASSPRKTSRERWYTKSNTLLRRLPDVKEIPDVYKSLGLNDNQSRATTSNNILRKISPSESNNTTHSNHTDHVSFLTDQFKKIVERSNHQQNYQSHINAFQNPAIVSLCHFLMRSESSTGIKSST